MFTFCKLRFLLTAVRGTFKAAIGGHFPAGADGEEVVSVHGISGERVAGDAGWDK
jgi:hypothetical protein